MSANFCGGAREIYDTPLNITPKVNISRAVQVQRKRRHRRYETSAYLKSVVKGGRSGVSAPPLGSLYLH